MAQETSPGPDLTVLDVESRDRLNSLVGQLDDRAADIIRSRYGLVDGRQHKLADIGSQARHLRRAGPPARAGGAAEAAPAGRPRPGRLPATQAPARQTPVPPAGVFARPDRNRRPSPGVEPDVKKRGRRRDRGRPGRALRCAPPGAPRRRPLRGPRRQPAAPAVRGSTAGRTLTMGDVHGVAALPGMALPAHDGETPARDVVPAYFRRYEAERPTAGGAPGAGRPSRGGSRTARCWCTPTVAPGRPAPWSTPPAPGTGRSSRRTRGVRRSSAASCTRSTTTARTRSARSTWSSSAAAPPPSRSSASWRRSRPRPG